MSEHAELLARVLGLPAEARAEFARELLLSLEGVEPSDESDRPLDPAWAEEIEARLRRYEAGETRAIPAEEAMGRIRGVLERMRVE